MKTLLILIAVTSLGCTWDIDCEIGSYCSKSLNGEGVCVGGLHPGDSYGARPGYDPMQLPDTYENQGSTCSYDTQCGSLLRCVKETGSMYGVCK